MHCVLVVPAAPAGCNLIGSAACVLAPAGIRLYKKIQSFLKKKRGWALSCCCPNKIVSQGPTDFARLRTKVDRELRKTLAADLLPRTGHLGVLIYTVENRVPSFTTAGSSLQLSRPCSVSVKYQGLT